MIHKSLVAGRWSVGGFGERAGRLLCRDARPVALCDTADTATALKVVLNLYVSLPDDPARLTKRCCDLADGRLRDAGLIAAMLAVIEAGSEWTPELRKLAVSRAADYAQLRRRKERQEAKR